MSLPQISEAEFEVMKIVWKYAPISTNEITEKLTQISRYSNYQLESKNNSNSYQETCFQKSSFLRKTKPGICLYSISPRR